MAMRAKPCRPLTALIALDATAYAAWPKCRVG
jgi:hypothetical protein